MTQETAKLRKTSNAYNIFILVLTVLSLAVMVVMLLPVSDATYKYLLNNPGRVNCAPCQGRSSWTTCCQS
jgi:hypothetical protein